MRRRPADDPHLDRQLSRLRRRGEVRALTKAARVLGVEAWLVGGAVRDALLDRPAAQSAEIDAAVSGDPEAVARALESAGAGRSVFLSRDRPGPRVFRVAGRKPLDIAGVEGGSIEVDLRRRDFTVNAVAVSLADGSVLDPFGGIPDLARRRLRPVRAENLLDDPLRALRAARFLATRGLVPDRETLAAARAAAPELSRVAVERVGAELSRILGSPRAWAAAAWAARAGLLPATLGRPLDSARTRRTISMLRRFDDLGTVRLPEEARRRVRLSALAVSLGLDGPGTGRWLAGRRLPRREVDEASRIVELSRTLPREPAGTEAWRWIVEAGPLLGEALHIVSRLDNRQRDRAAALRRLAGRRRPAVPVSGEDVMGWLGIAPGPRVGRLLSDLAVAVASGQVKSRREARNWLTGQVQSASERL